MYLFDDSRIVVDIDRFDESPTSFMFRIPLESLYVVKVNNPFNIQQTSIGNE